MRTFAEKMRRIIVLVQGKSWKPETQKKTKKKMRNDSPFWPMVSNSRTSAEAAYFGGIIQTNEWASWKKGNTRKILVVNTLYASMNETSFLYMVNYLLWNKVWYSCEILYCTTCRFYCFFPSLKLLERITDEKPLVVTSINFMSYILYFL